LDSRRKKKNGKKIWSPGRAARKDLGRAASSRSAHYCGFSINATRERIRRETTNSRCPSKLKGGGEPEEAVLEARKGVFSAGRAKEKKQKRYIK